MLSVSGVRLLLLRVVGLRFVGLGRVRFRFPAFRLLLVIDPLSNLAAWFNPSGWIYNILYAVIIVFFTYFYTAVVLNPNDLAENMRKSGGFIPGVRPGRKTAEYIDRVLSRITLPGAVYLAIIATIPDMLIASMGLPFLGFGGTSVLIVVGVALDTLQQVESHLLLRHYEGFVKRGRIRGRQRM